MLLASPVRLADAPDLDLELQLPEAAPHPRPGPRGARGAGEVGWPYLGYGVEFLFVPPDSLEALASLVGTHTPAGRPQASWTPRPRSAPPCAASAWIYEIVEPAPYASGFLVEIRRGPREGWRPGLSGPFYVVEGPSEAAALRAAREFVHRTPEAAPPHRAMPRVSILLPVRDAAPTLGPCLDSLLGQTLRRARGDRRGRRLHATGAARLSRHAARPRTRGCASCTRRRAAWSQALNLALAAARAPLLARMDADDVASPERLAPAGGRASSGTRRSDVLGCRVELLGGAGNAGMRAYVEWLERACSTTTRSFAICSSSRLSSTRAW